MNTKFLILLLAALSAPCSQAHASYATYAQADWQALQLSAQHAVVQVINYVGKQNVFEPFKNKRDDEIGMGAGTGFFIDEVRGELITNYHVIEGALRLEIMLPGESVSERFEVEVVGTNPELDIALLRLTKESRKKYETFLETIPGCNGIIQTVTLGDSDLLRATSQIMALGYPLNDGLKRSIGYLNGISQKWGRTYYQIDAVVNPGNSGGCALDNNGTVVGVVVAKHGNDGESTNYIIPINYVKNLLAGMREFGLLTLDDLGYAAQATTANVRALLNAKDTGIRIFQVRPGSPAAAAGMQAGDLLTHVGEYAINDDGQIKAEWLDVKISHREIFNRMSIGDIAELKIWRNNMSYTLPLTIPPSSDNILKLVYPPFTNLDYRAFAGLVIQPFSRNHAELLGKNISSFEQVLWLAQHSYQPNQQILIVSKLYKRSHAADQKNIREGSLISRVNGLSVHTLADLDAALLATSGEYITIETRDGYLVALHKPTFMHQEQDLQTTHGYAPCSAITA